MTKVFEDDLVLEQDKTFEESIKVEGHIKREEGTYPSLKVKGDIDAWNIDAEDIDAWSIDAGNIDAWSIDAVNIDAWSIDAVNIDAGDIDAGDIDAVNIDAGDIDAWDIDAGNIDAGNIDAEDIDAWDIDAKDIDARNISFYAFCIAYKRIRCASIEGRREDSVYKGLDNGVEIREKPEKCPKCGQKIRGEA